MSDFERKAIPSGSGPVALIILDGFGLRQDPRGNAVALARKPVFDEIWEKYPHTTLKASEEAVGLPEGQFGNSEVGHSNIGSGRVLYQDLSRINRSIELGDFFDNKEFQAAIAHVKQTDGALHLLGLASDGGVHSHIDHLMALLTLAQHAGLKKVYVHAVTDGRDVSPTSGKGFIQEILEETKKLGVGQIATIVGRYFAMDRDHRWERVEKAYRAFVHGDGTQTKDPVAAVGASYDAGTTDEFIEPIVVTDDAAQPVGCITDGDAVIMFNFRPDRAIQIASALTNPEFSGFEREKNPDILFVSMTKYSDAIHAPIAFPPTDLSDTLGEVVAKHGLTQLRIAETEKYPHVTFFFSGGEEQPFPGEERVLVPSPKVATYDLQPEMSAPEVAEKAAARIASGEVDVMILNFANPDMVGHTGDLEAAIKAIETVDEGLGKVLAAIEQRSGVALVTADHGNADIMFFPDTHEVCTTHTLARVPLIVTREGLSLRDDGVLADLAPTMLKLLGVPQPKAMTGHSLITD
jgi:2,3-bisphosphoglycerate-independent phosphoglycerate mutase